VSSSQQSMVSSSASAPIEHSRNTSLESINQAISSAERVLANLRDAKRELNFRK
jgi:hypothetical protein